MTYFFTLSITAEDGPRCNCYYSFEGLVIAPNLYSAPQDNETMESFLGLCEQNKMEDRKCKCKTGLITSTRGI